MRTGVLVVVTVLGLVAASPAAASTSVGAPVSPTARMLSQAPLASVTADVGPVPGLMATRVHWTRWSEHVVHGDNTVLEGQIVAEDGAVSGAEVVLYARRTGTARWSRVGTAVSSSSSGVFRLNGHQPSGNTDYRVVYQGTAVYGRSEAIRSVSALRRLRDSMRRLADGSFRFGGSVAPAYRHRRVLLQRKRCLRCAWTVVDRDTTTSRSRWQYRLVGPRSRGTWYYRAVVGADQRFVRSYSDRTWSLRTG